MRSLFVAIMCVVLVGLGQPVQAASRHDQMKAAISRVMKGGWTQADLALIRTDKTVAAQVPDPTKKDEQGSTFSTARSSARVTASGDICGRKYYAWFRKRSLLNSTIYKYWHRVTYCVRTGKVTRFRLRTDYLTKAQQVVYLRGRESNYTMRLSRGAAYSRMGRSVELCVAKYGCYENIHPWVGLTVRANNRNSYKGTAG